MTCSGLDLAGGEGGLLPRRARSPGPVAGGPNPGLSPARGASLGGGGEQNFPLSFTSFFFPPIGVFPPFHANF